MHEEGRAGEAVAGGAAVAAAFDQGSGHGASSGKEERARPVYRRAGRGGRGNRDTKRGDCDRGSISVKTMLKYAIWQQNNNKFLLEKTKNQKQTQE
ncbi:hypothetical protein ADE_19100 [Achromobacter denitrificans]|nr:hypothetical protein ADE_19100 [Achromobacter denitrificans]